MNRAVLSDTPIVITGPSGWIGLAFLAVLNRVLGSDLTKQV